MSTQFNYADVGVNIDMTPQVHSTDEVTLHIEVTVSSVQQYINIGGISQPVIQQSANVADIRLREGEVNILGGLSQSQDTSAGERDSGAGEYSGAGAYACSAAIIRTRSEPS